MVAVAILFAGGFIAFAIACVGARIGVALEALEDHADALAALCDDELENRSAEWLRRGGHVVE